jgi:hypothetical protein
MYDLYDEIGKLQREYSKKNNHRLEISISSDMDEWTCELAIEAWTAILSEGVGVNPIQAFELAKNGLDQVEKDV